MKKNEAKILHDECLERLGDMLKPGSTVYTLVRHVARSGMSRDISLFVVSEGSLVDVTFLAAHALGRSMPRSAHNRVIRVGGCGMDMCWALVNDLEHALFGKDERPFKASGTRGPSRLRKEDI